MSTLKPHTPELKKVFLITDNTRGMFLIFANKERADIIAAEHKTMYPNNDIIVIERVVHE